MSASTAEWDGIIRGLGIGAPEQPVDALRSRVLRSNLCHAADSFGQVRCNWVANPAIGIAPIAFEPSSSPRLIHTVGPWPIPLRHDGMSYALRVRLALHVADNTIDLHHVLYSARPPSGLGGLGTAIATLTGEPYAMPTWTDGVLLQMSPSQVADAIVTTSTVDANGDPVAVEQCLVALHIYASGTASEAWIDGIYAAEWQGDVSP